MHSTQIQCWQAEWGGGKGRTFTSWWLLMLTLQDIFRFSQVFRWTVMWFDGNTDSAHLHMRKLFVQDWFWRIHCTSTYWIHTNTKIWTNFSSLLSWLVILYQQCLRVNTEHVVVVWKRQLELQHNRWMLKYELDGLRKRQMNCLGCLPDASVSTLWPRPGTDSG